MNPTPNSLLLLGATSYSVVLGLYHKIYKLGFIFIFTFFMLFYMLVKKVYFYIKKMTERLTVVSNEMVSSVAKETRFKQLAVYQSECMGEQGLSAFTTIRVLDTNNSHCCFIVEDDRLDNPFVISPIQLEILSLRAEGLSGVQISRQSLISHQTVSNHLTNLLNRNEDLYGKRRTVTQFCVWALATGMIEDKFLATLKQIVEELGYPWR